MSTPTQPPQELTRAEPGALARLERDLLPLRLAVRARVPVGLRIGVRRWPAVLRYYLSPPALALDANPRRFGHLQAQRSSPLRRPGTTYDEALQAAKEANVRRAAQLINGVVVRPNERFSWHRRVGPPLQTRGFKPGPELHDGALTLGVGGGMCQVANLVYWLAVSAGMTITERHRHGQDLFPDSQRDVPFGCGATVFHPHRDLAFVNPTAQPLLLALTVRDGLLVGEARYPTDPGATWQIVETEHRFVRRDGQLFRENTLVRQLLRPGFSAVVEPLTSNSARVCYDVPEHR